MKVEISLKCAPMGQANNIPACVQIMAWCRTGHKPLSEPTLGWYVFLRIYASLGLSDLTMSIVIVIRDDNDAFLKYIYSVPT